MINANIVNGQLLVVIDFSHLLIGTDVRVIAGCLLFDNSFRSCLLFNTNFRSCIIFEYVLTLVYSLTLTLEVVCYTIKLYKCFWQF